MFLLEETENKLVSMIGNNKLISQILHLAKE